MYRPMLWLHAWKAPENQKYGYLNISLNNKIKTTAVHNPDFKTDYARMKMKP